MTIQNKNTLKGYFTASTKMTQPKLHDLVDTMFSLSGNASFWQSTGSTVSALSAIWGSGGIPVTGLQPGDNISELVNDIGYLTAVDLGAVPSLSANWNSVYTTVNSSSADTVQTFNFRTGNVLPSANDYTWNQINKTISNISDITTKSHTALTDIGIKTHNQIDNHISLDTTVHADATNLIHSTGNENISGVKIFFEIPELPTTDPTTDNQSTRKGYVDTFAQGLLPKNSCKVATVISGTLSSSFVSGSIIDNIVIDVNDRILIKDQAQPIENGIYTVTGGTPVRATDYNEDAEVVQGTFTYIATGATNENTQWVQYTLTPIIGVSAIQFRQLPSPPSYNASLGVKVIGNTFQSDLLNTGGIDLVGNQLTINVDNTTLELSANSLQLNPTLQYNWNSTHTTVQSNSANWDNVYSNLITNSANYLNQSDLSEIAVVSANWNSNYTTVNDNSANWNSAYSVISGAGYGFPDILPINYNPINYTVSTSSLSGHLNGIDNVLSNITEISLVSSNWNSNYTTVNSNSAAWGAGGLDLTDISSASGDWNSTHTTVNSNSASWTSTIVQNDTAPILGGNLDTNQKSVLLRSNIATNSIGVGEIIVDIVAGETVDFPDLVYINSDGKWWKTNASAISSCQGLIGTVLDSITADQACNVLIKGFIRNDSWSWTTGGSLYTATTAGAITQTAPTGENDVIMKIGISVSATRIFFDPQTIPIEYTV